MPGADRTSAGLQTTLEAAPTLEAARYEDVLAHVTFTGTGGKNSRLVPLWDQTRVWDPGD